ncbi:peptidoglycan D,D-transpeptidase FtsI family protein [Neolewinella agarilytica]|uniref:Penicillin-binding protein 2 n=1 Tax=Neolewinella agarilytica TaxID=478744 RepID=A0A1H9JPE6_9BACT|nr:penicillin-binding transpeptidase domain-containing protein [Neolewinella agarilytica]SEQ88669.1 penicillin-binding protein 2 [Neolewinella agarilytica]
MTGSNTTRQVQRGTTIRIIILIIAAMLVGKAVHLQVFSEYWQGRAARVGESKEKLYPARGLMADRNGKLLTINEPVYQIEMIYNQFIKEHERFDTSEFCRLLQISPEYFENAIPKQWAPKYSKSKPFIFLANVSPRKYATFQENLFRFPGFSASLRSSRNYPRPVAAHVLGYMGEVDQRAIDREGDRYSTGDYHGISGLEYKYEKDLRGEKGERWLYRDRLGRAVGSSGVEEEAVVGSDLITTIDLDLQQYGESLMVNKVGTVIAIEPATGEILTMISAPTYNPRSLRIGRDRSSFFTQLQRDTLQPLLNRAINGKYAPGSPFKTLVALIGLQTGTLDANRGMACRGGFWSGGKMLLGCHSHPYVNNVEQAIAQSCNNYFVTSWLENVNRYGGLSPVEGMDDFNDYLYQFGLGRKLGIDFPGEISGFVPTSEFYAKRFADEQYWRAIWIRSLAIGQGEYELTSLQITNFIAAIANRGHWYTPHLVKQMQVGNEGVGRPVKVERHDIDIDRQHFETVVEGMRQTVTNGTARLAFTPGIDICGKTGTIQNRYGDHSAFTAFAPKDNPKIAILVYIENGGYGGSVAAPIASLMIEKYLNGNIAKNRKWLEQRMFDKDMTNRGETSIREVR